MSPLWRDEVGVYLAPQRICLVRLQRGVRPRVIDQGEVALAGQKDGYLDAIDALCALLQEPRWHGARLRVVLADHWVRYVVVPWSDRLSSAAERLAHARQLLTSIYGEAVADWELRLSDAAPRMNRVACALPGELLAALRAACAASGMQLLSLQPQLLTAYEAWRHLLPRGNAWFVSIEPGSLAAARLTPLGWDRVHSIRMGSDWLRELRRLQTFGRLVSVDPSEGRVYVDAPQVWREVAVLHTPEEGESWALHWLDEEAVPLSTLHQLNRRRRLAA